MDLKILDEKKSALPRKELEAMITFEKQTPSRQEIKKELVKKTSAKDNLLVVKKIQTYYGDNQAKVSAVIYDNEEAMNSLEFKTMIEKNKKKEEKPVEAEKTVEEAPKDEKVEEPKVEEEKPAEAPKVEEKPKETSEEKKGDE